MPQNQLVRSLFALLTFLWCGMVSFLLLGWPLLVFYANSHPSFDFFFVLHHYFLLLSYGVVPSYIGGSVPKVLYIWNTTPFLIILLFSQLLLSLDINALDSKALYKNSISFSYFLSFVLHSYFDFLRCKIWIFLWHIWFYLSSLLNGFFYCLRLQGVYYIFNRIF